PRAVCGGTRSPSFDNRNRDGVPALILDGRSLAADLRTELVARTNALRDSGVHPRLAVVFVGENDSSLAYVRNLARTGDRVGIEVAVNRLPSNATPAEIRSRLKELQEDASTHGVMLQQPLPAPLAIREIADAIPPHKDVDGTHP